MINHSHKVGSLFINSSSNNSISNYLRSDLPVLINRNQFALDLAVYPIKAPTKLPNQVYGISTDDNTIAHHGFIPATSDSFISCTIEKMIIIEHGIKAIPAVTKLNIIILSFFCFCYCSPYKTSNKRAQRYSKKMYHRYRYKYKHENY